jgi:glycosyltransferase involved in cell wall biosynthesis
MKVTAILNTFNRSEQLNYGLRSLLSKEVIPNEVIVVDDGSTDNTAGVMQLIMADFPNIEWQYIQIPQETEKEYSRISCVGKNIAIKKATGDVLVFSDPEIVHPGDTLAILLDRLQQDPPSVPIATQIWTMGERIYKKLDLDHFQRPATMLTHPYAQLTTGNMQNMKAPDSDWAISGSMNCFAGCFFVCFKKDIMAIGGLDEEMQGHGWEDWDLFHRFEASGLTLAMINEPPIIHLWHSKKYSVNIYEAAERNGKLSEQNIRTGKIIANQGKEWGVL